MNKWIASYMVLSGLLLNLGGCNTMESSGATDGREIALRSSWRQTRNHRRREDFVGRVAADCRIGKFTTPTSALEDHAH
jgi:hypothetical protein